MPLAGDDIWTFALAKVNNKGVWQRLGHSSRLHSVRSALNSKGSFGSKALSGLGAVARASFSMIPLPIIGSLLSSAHGAVEKGIKGYYHKKNHTKDNARDPSELNVKFQIKELSIENLDRYRYKVTDSVAEMQAAMTAYNAAVVKAFADKKRCEADLQLALKIMQCERRIGKFEVEIAGLMVVLEASKEWVEGARRSLAGVQNQVTKTFADDVKKEMDWINVGSTDEEKKSRLEIVKEISHANCDSFCHHGKNAYGSSWDTFRQHAATTINILQSPFSAETFLSTNYASYSVDDQMKNYKAPPPAPPA